MYDQISTKELEQIRVSYYKNYTASSAETITLQQWIYANKNNSIVPKIRPIKIADPDKYQKVKTEYEEKTKTLKNKYITKLKGMINRINKAFEYNKKINDN